MNTQSNVSYDDEIDLVAILKDLWNGRLIIVISTLAIALIAFAVSKWFLPNQYTATAYLIIGKPVVQYQNTNGAILVNPPIPDIKALPANISAATLLNEVKADTQVKSIIPSDTSNFPLDMQVAVVGTTQISLTVVDTNPKRAAAIANVWAQKAADWIELNYGYGAFMASIGAQITETQKNYADAEATFESIIAQDQTPILQNQIDVKNEIHGCLERRLIAENSILQRMEELGRQIPSTDDPLTLPNTFLLSAIQQDISNLENCSVTAKILHEVSVNATNGFSAAHGLEIIDGLRKIVGQDIIHSQTEQQNLQMQIMDLQEKIARFNYQMAEQDRLLSNTEFLYSQLTFQKMVIENILQESGRVAYVSMKAVEPKSTSSPKPYVVAGVAGVIGFLLGLFGVITTDWWKKTK